MVLSVVEQSRAEEELRGAGCSKKHPVIECCLSPECYSELADHFREAGITFFPGCFHFFIILFFIYLFI